MSNTRTQELKNGDELNQGEIDLYFWQYNRLGSFKTHLFDAMAKADTINLNLLAKGFPEQVQAYRNYTGLEGFWNQVKLKMDIMI